LLVRTSWRRPICSMIPPEGRVERPRRRVPHIVRVVDGLLVGDFGHWRTRLLQMEIGRMRAHENHPAMWTTRQTTSMRSSASSANCGRSHPETPCQSASRMMAHRRTDRVSVRSLIARGLGSLAAPRARAASKRPRARSCGQRHRTRSRSRGPADRRRRIDQPHVGLALAPKSMPHRPHSALARPS
jgi:hypothetical protein